MVISRGTDGKYGNNTPIEKVVQFTYLGTMINDNWDHSQKIWCRIEKAKADFNQMDKLFKSHNLIKFRLLQCYIFSILFYGMESRALKATQRKLESLMLRISCVDRDQ